MQAVVQIECMLLKSTVELTASEEGTDFGKMLAEYHRGSCCIIHFDLLGPDKVMYPSGYSAQQHMLKCWPEVEQMLPDTNLLSMLASLTPFAPKASTRTFSNLLANSALNVGAGRALLRPVPLGLCLLIMSGNTFSLYSFAAAACMTRASYFYYAMLQDAQTCMLAVGILI